jgi:LysR family hydrogen peroxide-inducible transcriptional activator
MTLTELKYIVAVARERHFGRAAEACFVSQPTLSVAIRKLEDELGVVLFERGGVEVGITPIGLRVVSQAQRVLEEGAKLREIAHQGHDPLEGPLRVGVIYTVGPYLLPYPADPADAAAVTGELHDASAGVAAPGRDRLRHRGPAVA